MNRHRDVPPGEARAILEPIVAMLQELGIPAESVSIRPTEPLDWSQCRPDEPYELAAMILQFPSWNMPTRGALRMLSCRLADGSVENGASPRVEAIQFSRRWRILDAVERDKALRRWLRDNPETAAPPGRRGVSFAEFEGARDEFAADATGEGEE